jgi:AcrR family transcriptional regulator
MAKSNVLRYFESRESVLLELCTEALTDWVSDLEPRLAEAVDPADPASARADRIAAVIAGSLAERPVLCDLMSAQASVLEHNISTDTVLRYKRNAIANVNRLAGLVAGHLPELGAENAAKFTALAALLATSTWTHAQAPPAVIAAYESDATLAPYRLEFESTLRNRWRSSWRACSTDERVDGARTEHLVEHHDGAADYRRAVPVRGGHDGQRPGRLGSRVAVQRLPQPGDEDLVGPARSPDTTRTAGLSRFTAAATISPTYLPLSRIIRRASASPPLASSTTSRMCRTGRPCCCSACTTAQPPAMASRQPVSPHRHEILGPQRSCVPELSRGLGRTAL